MAISFNSIPVSIRTPGAYIEIDNSRAVQGTAAIKKKVLCIGQKLSSVQKKKFVGSGLDDATSGGAYTGTGTALFEIEITSAATPDVFKWRKNGGTYTTGVNVSGTAQTLSDGVTVTFAATTGHTLADKWFILASKTTVAAATPVRVLKGQQHDFFGVGSVAAKMLTAYFKANETTETWACCLADAASGTHATCAVTFTAQATDDGTVYFYIGGERITLALTSADAVATLAANLATAINAIPELPCYAYSAAGVCTLVAKNAGTLANGILVQSNFYLGEKNPDGLAYTIGGSGQFASGATDPTTSSVITAIGDVQYDYFIHPFTDATNLTALENELEARWGPMTQIEGLAFGAYRSTVAGLSTFGNTRNSPFQVILGLVSEPTNPFEAAAILAGIAAYYLEIDPARPLQRLKLVGMIAAHQEDQMNRAERDVVLTDGVATLYSMQDGTCWIERAVTTYQTSPAGIPDVSYLDVETLATLAYLRYAVRSRVLLRFPRHKLASDSTFVPPGQAVATPSSVRAEIVGLMYELQDSGIVESVDSWKAKVLVERNANDVNRLDMLLPADITNQFRVLAGSIPFIL